MVKARWAEARARAMAEGRPYRFAIIENTGKFRVAPEGSEYWDGVAAGTPPASGNAGQSALVIEDTLPKEMKFVSPEGSTGHEGSEWACSIVFLPNGTTREDAQIAFCEEGSQPVTLRVRAVTGAATTSR
jgi:hypothetical protein